MTRSRTLYVYKIFSIIIITITTIILGLQILQVKFDAQMRVTSSKNYTQETSIIIIHDQLLFSANKLNTINHLITNLNQLINKPTNQQVNSSLKIHSLYNLPNLAHYFSSNTNTNHPAISSNDSADNIPSLLINQNYIADTAAQARQDSLQNSLALNRFINTNANTMAIYINTPTTQYGDYSLKLHDQIQTILNQYQSQFDELYQVGIIDLRKETVTNAINDLRFILPLIISITIIVFGWLFRSWICALCPLLIFILTTIWTVGIIGYFDIPLNTMVAVVLIYVYSISTAECAFFFNAFGQLKLEQRLPIGQLIKKTYRLTLIPALLATMTTVLGFLFNSLSDAMIIKNFALTISIAIITSMIICLITMPLLLNKLGNQPKTIKPDFKHLIHWLIKLNTVIDKHQKKLMIIFIGFIVVSIYAALQLNINALPYAFVNHSDSFYQKMLKTQHYLTGIDSYTIQLNSQQKNYFFQQPQLKRLFHLEQKISQLNQTSTTLSVATLIASTYQAYLENNPEFYKIPERQSAIDQILPKILEQDDLLLNPTGTQAKIIVNFSAKNSEELKHYQKQLTTILEKSIKPPLAYSVDGLLFGYNDILAKLINLQFVSLAIIFFITALVLIYLLKTYRALLITFIPNLIPISTALMSFWLFDYAINALNILVFALTTGLAVDDTIHLTHCYRKFYRELSKKSLIANKQRQQNNNDIAQQTLAATLTMQVRPVSITSLALLLGGIALQLSHVDIIRQTGVIFSIVIASAWFADITITPVLLKNIYKK